MRSQLPHKPRVTLVGLLVLGVVLALTLTVIYISYRPKGVRVDLVVEIGLGGLPRTFLLAEQLEWSEVLSKLEKRVEAGGDLIATLDTKYGFDNSSVPSLVVTIPKTQHRVYGRVIKLTAEGKDVESTTILLEDISDWIVRRHSDLTLEYQKNLGEFEVELDRRFELESAYCNAQRLATEPMSIVCRPEVILGIADLRASLSQKILYSPVTATKVLLPPTARMSIDQ